jgi:hypothetical protein
MLVRDRDEIGGRDDYFADVLGPCQALDLIQKDLSVGHTKAAAKRLIKSKEFNGLYISHEEFLSMKKYILNEAYR